MPRAKISGELTSFKLDADLRAAIIEEFGKQGMAAYLRRTIRDDLERRGCLPGATTAAEPKPITSAEIRPSEALSQKTGLLSKNPIVRPRAKDPRYTVWKRMKARIPEWNDFPTFANDVGARPRGAMLLRHDTSQPHGPTNSYWGSAKQRNHALPHCQKHIVDGREKSLSELARDAGLKTATFTARLRKGMPLEEALNPVVRWGGPGRTRPR